MSPRTAAGAAAAARRDDLRRIADALAQAGALLAEYARRDLDVEHKAPGHPVTAADRAADHLLRRLLPREDEGWLSEETADDPVRLDRRRVWVVDPLDGTKEFIAGIPEWCVSVALVEDGRPVAGGVYNPAAGHTVLGAEGLGVTFDGEAARMSAPAPGRAPRVLASRSEILRGEWNRWREAGFDVVPTGSVAYKLALVAAGRADATWTLTPKSEWDVAAGAALVAAAGGSARLPSGEAVRFNQRRTRLPGLVAAAPGLLAELVERFQEEGVHA
jgi:myo-inositol-1(or 4)-monophosphatase